MREIQIQKKTTFFVSIFYSAETCTEPVGTFVQNKKDFDIYAG